MSALQRVIYNQMQANGILLTEDRVSLMNQIIGHRIGFRS